MLFQKSQYDAARVVKENKTSQLETEPSGKIETQVLIQGKYYSNANRRKDFGAEPIDSSHTAQKLYLQQKQHTLSDRISFAH